MFRKLSETFTATHFTILAGLAIIAPSALYATVATTAVSITDPNSGLKSYIDGGRRLYVYDPVAGYANYPGNLVDIPFNTDSNNATCSGVLYTVPAAKALVIREISGYFFNRSTSGSFYLQKDSGCNSTSEVTSIITSIASFSQLSISLGTGAAIPSGTKLYAYNSNSTTHGYIHGYLVPAGSVPAAGSAAAAEMNVPVVNAPKPSSKQAPR